MRVQRRGWCGATSYTRLRGLAASLMEPETALQLYAPWQMDRSKPRIQPLQNRQRAVLSNLCSLSLLSVLA